MVISSVILLSCSKYNITKPIGESIGIDFVGRVTCISQMAPLLIARQMCLRHQSLLELGGSGSLYIHSLHFLSQVFCLVLAQRGDIKINMLCFLFLFF